MQTIHRQKTKYRPIPNKHSNTTFLHAHTPTQLIHRADEWCNRYGFDYDTQIYRVIEMEHSDILVTPNRNYKKSSKFQDRDTLKKQETIYYEVQLRKVVAS